MEALGLGGLLGMGGAASGASVLADAALAPAAGAAVGGTGALGAGGLGATALGAGASMIPGAGSMMGGVSTIADMVAGKAPTDTAGLLKTGMSIGNMLQGAMGGGGTGAGGLGAAPIVQPTTPMNAGENPQPNDVNFNPLAKLAANRLLPGTNNGTGYTPTAAATLRSMFGR